MSVFKGVKLPKILYETQSDYNGAIQVVQVGDTRRLRVGKITQSINWDSPFATRMVWGGVVDLLKEQEPNLRNILVLGLGGGTMQQLISKSFPETQITSVELDATIIAVAKDYFNLGEMQNHTIINDDALRVIAEPEAYGLKNYSFDAIVVDIYCGQDYPDLGNTGSFIGNLRNLVRPEGLIIFNRIYIHSHQEDVNNFIKQIEGYLNNVTCNVVAGKTNSDNVLIFGRT